MGRIYLVAVALLSMSLTVRGGDHSPAPQLTAEQIAERMTQMDQWRVAVLQDYTVTRRYVLDNKRFHKHAEMEVRMTYSYPGKKEFVVLSESGSGAVRRRVFYKLIEAEVEGAQHQDQTRITPANYEFELLGNEAQDGRPCYVIAVTPKTKNKLLLRGRVWVDAQDFAIVRIEGSPAKNPSFWTRKIHFEHRYQKIDPFWLAATNRSETDVWIFGKTELTIEYLGYQINRGQPENKTPWETSKVAGTVELTRAAVPVSVEPELATPEKEFAEARIK